MKKIIKLISVITIMLIATESYSQVPPLSFTIDDNLISCDSSELILTNTTDSVGGWFYYRWVIDYNSNSYIDPYFGTSFYYAPVGPGVHVVWLKRYADPNYTVIIDSLTMAYTTIDTCGLNTGISYAVNNVIDCNTSDVSMQAFPSNGIAPYSYVWSYNGITSTLPSPTFLIDINNPYVSLTLTDAVGESVSTGIDVYFNNIISLNLSMNYTVISSDCNNTVLQFFGATSEPNPTFGWTFDIGGIVPITSTVQNPIITIPSGANYLVSYLDVSSPIGCQDVLVETFPFTFNNLSGYSISDNTSPNPCAPDSCLNQLTLVANNGTAPYLYFLNGLTSTSPIFNNLCDGSYNAYIQDANGCIFTLPSINLTTIDSCDLYAGINYTVDNIIDCNTSGVLMQGFASDGVAPYSYLWSYNGITYTSPSPYIVVDINNPYVELTVTDALGETATTGIDVYFNNFISLNLTMNYTVISSDCNNTVLQFFGATSEPNPIFDWTFDFGGIIPITSTVQNPIVTIPTSVNYLISYLNVSNASGCQDFLVETLPLTFTGLTGSASVANTSTNPCFIDSCMNQITLIASNGTAPFQYSLDGLTFFSSPIFDNLCDGSYNAIIQDANGCATSFPVYVIDTTSMFIQEYTYFATCDSNSTGGNNSYMLVETDWLNTVTWSDGFIGTYYANPAPGSYDYIVSSPNGCTASGTIVVPDNECYTISGYVYVDIDGDCIYNGADYALSNVWVDLADDMGNWYWIYDYTDANGYYEIQVGAGEYYIDVNGYYANAYTQTCPDETVSYILDAANPVINLDIFMTPPPPTQDLSVSIYNITTFTPGFPFWTVVSYCNDGTIPMSGSVEFNYDANLTYVAGSSSSVDIVDDVNNILTWSFTNLLPGQCLSAYPDFTTSTSAVLGSTMSNTAIINPIPGDVTPSNNTAYVIDTVVGSWDPNDKAVFPLGDMTTDDKDHSYTIRFQNEGTAAATLVVVRDDLDDNLDLQTLRNVSSSHNFVLTIENDDELVFTFNNIMLPAMDDDEEASQGYINFTISQKADLAIGTVINNTADIYFDFNEAVVTNTTENIIVNKFTDISEILNTNDLNIYPNPSNGLLNIETQKNNVINNVSVFNILGEVVYESKNINNKSTLINIDHVTDGIYLIKTETEKGISFKKVTVSNKK